MDVGNSPNSSDDNTDDDTLFAKLYEIYFSSDLQQPPQQQQQQMVISPPPPPPPPDAAAMDLAEQRRRQEEELSTVKVIQSFEAQQQLLLWQHIYWQQLKRPVVKKDMAFVVAAANVQTVDSWAWRKYGQKPIKGCTYPRNYYRCSTSKGCTAKKQVEKIRVDPDFYMVTYKGDHVHLNPVQPTQLPGSVLASLIDVVPVSHQLLLPPPLVHPPPPPLPPEIVRQTPKAAIELDEDEEGMLIPNLMVDQDIIRSMEELKKYYKRLNNSGDGSGSSSGSGSSGGPGFN